MPVVRTVWCVLWVLILASVVQCLERHDVPALPGVVPGGVWGACGCSVVFVGGFSGGVTPGPFPNPEAKPACADGTAPGRVWESRSPPAFFFVCGGVVSPLTAFVVTVPVRGWVVTGVVGVWHHPTTFLCPFPPLARAEGAGVWGSRASAQGKSRVTRGCGARDPPGGDESNGGAVGRGRRSPAPRPDAAAGTSVRPQCQYGVSMRRSSPVSGSVNARTFAVRPIGRLWSSSSMNGTYGSGSSRSCRATSLISA